jgi:hypothetical protein
MTMQVNKMKALVKVPNKRRITMMKRVEMMLFKMRRRRRRTRMENERSFLERTVIKHALCLLAVSKHLILAVYNLIRLNILDYYTLINYIKLKISQLWSKKHLPLFH